MKGKFDDWMFGCDVCQDVCPGIDFQNHYNEPFFQANPDILNFKSGLGKKLQLILSKRY